MGYTAFAEGKPHQGVTRADLAEMVPVMERAIEAALELEPRSKREAALRSFVYNMPNAPVTRVLATDLIIARLARSV